MLALEVFERVIPKRSMFCITVSCPHKCDETSNLVMLPERHLQLKVWIVQFSAL